MLERAAVAERVVPASWTQQFSILLAWACGIPHRTKQFARRDEVWRIEALSEPAVDRCKQFARCLAFSLPAQKLGQISRGPQFPQPRALLSRLGKA